MKHWRMSLLLLTLFGILVGAFLATQTAVNSHLKSYLSSTFLASFISFTIGTLFLLVIMIVTGQSVFISLDTFADYPFWIWIGGFLGVVTLTVNMFLFKELGSIEAAILPIFGNIIMGMMIDHFGWYFTDLHPFDWMRLFGVIFLILGILVAVVLRNYIYNRNNIILQDKEQNEAKKWMWRLIGIAAGMGTATQVAVNGYLGIVLESKTHSAFISFLVGMITLLIIVLVRQDNIREIANPVKAKAPLFVWIGGLLGAGFVLGNVLLANTIGTGQTVVLTLFGMMIGSTIIQQFGLFKSIKVHTSVVQIAGLVLMLVGVVFIKLL